MYNVERRSLPLPTIKAQVNNNANKAFLNKYIDEIDWRKKEEIKYDLDLFDPYFYITYRYNNIMYDNELLKNIDKLNSYAIFHWLQIGYKHFKFVPNRNLIKIQ